MSVDYKIAAIASIVAVSLDAKVVLFYLTVKMKSVPRLKTGSPDLSPLH